MSGCIRTTVHHAVMASAATEELQEIATLRVDDEVDAVFACTRKDRHRARTGAPYLTLELRDATGSMVARAFRDVDILDGRFDRGDLVRVRGRVARFRDQLQIEARSIDRADALAADPASFLPTAYRDLDELEGFLEHLSREVYDAQLARLLRALLGDSALRTELRRAPCSPPPPPGRAGSGAHHAYLGGLLEHTVAVATLTLELCTLHPRLDRDLLLCAAIVHDLGKTREFTYGAEVQRSAEGRLLGHVELGLRVIGEHAPTVLEPERRLALEHCVLLHHGSEAAGGQRFASAEALALYRLNALDAHVKSAFERPGTSRS
jgi:3'-5' exoribonuclease